MAAPYNPPVKNQDFIIYVSLGNPNNSTEFIANPTIASGDWKVSKDGGSFTNLSTLPAVTPAGGIMVKITLSATEMNADNVVIQGVDQTATKAWTNFVLSIPTTSA